MLAPLLDDAAAKRIALEVDVPNHCAMAGDEALIGILLRNLCDNALRYAPAEGQVRFRVADGTTTLQVSIEDSGHGMTTAQIARLGERFYRVAGNDAEGSGLGWSIIRRIAAVTGAKLDIGSSAELGGLRVTVTWPRAERRNEI